jgi:hypothetical protein
MFAITIETPRENGESYVASEEGSLLNLFQALANM